MTKGFNINYDPVPYPDEKEAEKVLISQEDQFLKMYKSRIADPKTGRTYAEIVKTGRVYQTAAEVYKPSDEDVKKFMQANPNVMYKNGIWCEINPLNTAMEDETQDSVTLPNPESLFN